MKGETRLPLWVPAGRRCIFHLGATDVASAGGRFGRPVMEFSRGDELYLGGRCRRVRKGVPVAQQIVV